MKLLVLLSFVVTVLCSRVSLPAYALAVKNPYLSTWFPGGGSAEFPTAKPFFWRRNDLTWYVVARVNNKAYCLLGCADGGITPAKQTDLEFTSTHTLVTLEAGSTTFLLDFFSPVSMTDYVRQSIPFSYLTVSVEHSSYSESISILSAIDQTWTAQTDTEVDLSRGHSSLIYKITGKDSIPFTELNDMATYGSVVLAASTQHGQVSYQTGDANDVLSQFTKYGSLRSSHSAGYSSGDVAAFTYNLGHSSKPSPVTFAVGFERNPTIQWLNVSQAAYYQSKYDSTEDVVDHFFADEQAARSEADGLDSKVRQIGSAISENYSDLLESSIRQIWGGMELTVPMDTKDTKQAKAFMKEISTDGNVNTLADLIPKALPAFYVLAPDYIRLLLEPIMEYTLVWPGEFAFHDLGKHYPNATGETIADQEQLLLDQTSVIHWMAYAYQKATGDTDWIKPYLVPMKKYADYLVTNGLYPPSQQSSVDSIGPTPNQTVLAIYSAIGLTAFGALSGQHEYTSKGHEYAPQILAMGEDSAHTHVKAHYNDTDDAWISTYPFGFDLMLQLGTFNASTYAMQSDWYAKQLHPLGMQFYDGVPYTVSELSLWCAATSSDEVRGALIDAIHKVLTSKINVVVGPTQWNVTGENQGAWFLSTAKSLIGSYFMPAAVMQKY